MPLSVYPSNLALKNIAITIVIGILPLISFRNRSDGGLEQRKYKNFVEAFKNCSTFSYFTVITVKDLKDNITKEICVKGNFVNGAVHIELDLDYNSSGDRRVEQWALAKKDRYFEFKRRKALENISFFSYDTELMRAIQKKYDFDSVISRIRKTKKFSIELPDDEMKAFAHVLFNKGYLTGESNCWGGTLVYVDGTQVQ